MKNSCKVVLSVFLLVLFANAQEVPPPLSSDSSLATTPTNSLSIAVDSSLAVTREYSHSSFPIAKASEQEKAKKKGDEKKTSKKSEEYNPEDYQKNLRIGAYFHPLPFIFGAAYNMFMFTSTIEVPLNLGSSVIIQPTVWLGSSDGYIPDVVKSIYFMEDKVEYKKLKRVGSGIGFRQYAFDKSEGLYLQAIASAYYIKAESLQHKKDSDDSDSWGEIDSYKNLKGVVGEFMLYLGSVHKWQNISFSYEGGLGFGYDGTDTYQMGYTNRLVTNFNICVGIPF